MTPAGRNQNNRLKMNSFISVKIKNEELFRFNKNSGVLYVSMSEQSIHLLVQKNKGLPIAKLLLPDRENKIHEFLNVKEIRPLPRKDGTFFMSIQKQSLPNVPPAVKKTSAIQKPKRSWIRRIFGL